MKFRLQQACLDTKLFEVNNKGADQAARMRRLIC